MATVVGVGNYVVARLLVQYMPAVFQAFSVPFMIVALLTMIFGGAMTLVQDDVKYLFAWSTMSQNAYSLLGIGSLTVLGLSGGIFYFLSHILGKCILFSVAGILLARTGVRDMKQMGGLASKMPLTATLCLIGGLILSAVPPTSGFQAEWIMFVGIFFQGAYGVTTNLVIAVLGIIATALTVAYTFWPVRRIFFGPLPAHLQSVTEAPLVDDRPPPCPRGNLDTLGHLSGPRHQIAGQLRQLAARSEGRSLRPSWRRLQSRPSTSGSWSSSRSWARC